MIFSKKNMPCGYTLPGQFKGKDVEVSVGIKKIDDLINIFNYNKTQVDYKSMKDLFNNC